ncbi:class I SAM-dependent methyltransferase [Microcoleus vaginatus]|uniref:class I SAM-dependent methyltransferase n=1 Tax=Microcoleus vaginatus TaxID=119532 RepID=UPI0018EFDDB3
MSGDFNCIVEDWSVACVDFITKVHTSTKRNYVERVVEYDKAECAAVAKQYGKDYWDGDRKYGYGGYRYDGRWRAIAEKMAQHYGIKSGDKILDVGCGKGYLLYEFTQAVPGLEIVGIDISEYAIQNAKEEVKPFLTAGNAVDLPFPDKTFDFVVSILTLHNLYNYEVRQALQEIERVGKQDKYIVVESYRNEEEKVNLLYWQLTCQSFYTPQEWEWFFKESGYTGDYGCIFFE